MMSLIGSLYLLSILVLWVVWTDWSEAGLESESFVIRPTEDGLELGLKSATKRFYPYTSFRLEQTPPGGTITS
jgi:hypothetical protein